MKQISQCSSKIKGRKNFTFENNKNDPKKESNTQNVNNMFDSVRCYT